MITINQLLKTTLPPLSESEFAGLEAGILRHGCRDPIVLWDGVIVDGHNRHQICTRHNLPFQTVDMEFESIHHARIWMRDNQNGKRNATDAWKIDCALENKADMLEIGKAKMAEGGGDKKSDDAKSGLSQNDKPDHGSHNTRQELAKSVGMSTGQFAKGEQVKKKDPALWEKAKAGEVSIAQAYKAVTPPKEKPEQPQEEEDEEPEPVVEDGVTDKPVKFIESNGMGIFYVAKSHMEKIAKNDTERMQALSAMMKYCEERISQNK